MVSQGVADADKNCLTIEVGARGKQSDGGTFVSSEVFYLIENDKFNMPTEINLPATNIKFPRVFGDEAYPLKPYLMRPFPSQGLNAATENVNNHLSRALKCIKCAFGILQAKWKLFEKDIEVSSKKAIIIIKFMYILHNIIREKDGNSDLDYCNIMLGTENTWENETTVQRARGANALQRAKYIKCVRRLFL